MAISQPYGKPATLPHTPSELFSSLHFGNGSPRQLLEPDIVHESKSEKHMAPSDVGLAFSWYDVGHIQVDLAGPARPPAQKLVSFTQRYCSGVPVVPFQATLRSVELKSTPVELQPEAYKEPAGGGASQWSCVSKHWNSLPCGSAPAGTCSAVHAQELLALDELYMEPKASAMPLPHHVRSSAQREPSAVHGFSASASQLLWLP